MQHVVPHRRRPRFGLAGAAATVAAVVSALALTAAGPGDASREAAAAMQSQKCVLCGRAFAEKMAQLCASCDRGKCFKCGGAFPDKVARVCSSCFKDKCINCGRAFPDKAAKLCNRCVN
jgi:hypothetical protein